MKKKEAASMESVVMVFQPKTGKTRVHVRLEEGTVWLTQMQMAELYGTTKQNISTHVRNIFAEEEHTPAATVKDYLTVRTEGSRTVRRNLEHYSLDMILAVGYRVRSTVATRFRQWATERLSEYLVKGFTLDDERLKGGSGLADHFDELLARIREIRASEARVYQRIREIFSLAVDYQEGAQETQRFFAVMQNKMHYSATGLTAAEIVRQRADATKQNMGLTNWKGDRVLKRDIGTAKNYLDAGEIDILNRITVMFLDQAEFRAQRRQDIRMRDWEQLLDKFLRDTELAVLPDAGSVGHEEAINWAETQYESFALRRQQEAEVAAEARYLEDLHTTARTLETTRTTPSKQEKPKAPRRKGGTRK